VADLTLPGSIGGAPDRVYTPIYGNDPLHPESFAVGQLPPQSTDFQYSVIMSYESAAQRRVLFQLLALALPKRGYIDFYNDPTQKMFVRQTNYFEMSDPDQGLKDSIFKYTVEDIYEVESYPPYDPYYLAHTVKPIKEITVELNPNPEEEGPTGPTLTVE
jgi:hypothetical protein